MTVQEVVHGLVKHHVLEDVMLHVQAGVWLVVLVHALLVLELVLEVALQHAQVDVLDVLVVQERVLDVLVVRELVLVHVLDVLELVLVHVLMVVQEAAPTSVQVGHINEASTPRPHLRLQHEMPLVCSTLCRS